MSPNLYDLPDPLPDDEEFTDLIPDRGVKVERIVSRGRTAPAGEWYDQNRDEWVVLVQGEAVLEYENGETLRLGAGDHVLIPAHRRHRVNYTSRTPPCIWIAVFGKLA
ncbi:MAG: cupin domain-containing protein [Deltaproteobacteria bacterium]|nr:cupin domain-containing protein [Deltaproteobacteria bacterium]